MMRNFTKPASLGLSFLLFCGAAFAQVQKPETLHYNLYKAGEIDGRQNQAGNTRPYYMKQPSQQINANIIPASALFIKAPMPASKSLSLVNETDRMQLAFEFLNSISSQLGIADASQSFSMVAQQQDNIGYSHVKMQEVYNGVPVFGIETIVHMKDGQDAVVNGSCIPLAQLSYINTSPSFTADNAQNVAVAALKKETGWADLSDDAKKVLHYTGPEKELVIFPDFKDKNILSLAWHFTIRPNALERWEYFVDAHTGAVLFHYDNTCTDGPATGQGTDLHSATRALNLYQVGSKYYMVDASKAMFNSSASSMPDNPAGGIRTVDANNTELTTLLDISSATTSFWPDKSSVSAHYNAGLCYDYYKSTFGRNGLDGNGGTMLSVVNVTSGGFAMDNAYWNGQLMAYGNGNKAFDTPLAAALDVTGHEMTHGVVQSTANLTYQDQSGAINESMADIFGCMIERKNWTIGEDVVNLLYFPSGALRDLSDPHNGGSKFPDNGWQPAKMSEYVTTTDDHGGVHVNSGICNFAFYKFATSVSKDTAEKIYYRALTLYLTRSSQFIDLRLAVVQAAADLYGSASKEVTAAKNAFDAVQIYDGSGNDFQQDLAAVYGTDFLLVHKAPYKDTALYLVKPGSPGAHDYHPFIVPQAINKPSVTDDGLRGYFIDEAHNINKLAVDTLKIKDFVIKFTGFSWNNVAISKDSSKLALTRTPNDTSIYILDIHNPSKPTYVRYHLFNPTYASGIETGGPVYANSLEWDPTGEYVMYDSYNQIGSGSTKINYWDVGFLKAWDNSKTNYGDGTITKLFASLPKGVDITNPAYSKNSPYIITYDYYNELTNTYQIYTSNIEHGFDSSIYTNNTFGYPSFSKNDNMLAFTSIGSNKDTVIMTIPLHKNKMSASGSASVLLKGYKWPIWYTRGLRKGVQALYSSVGSLLCMNGDNVFYSASLGKISSYSWNFGSNATPSASTSPGPITVKYSKAGTQTISLTVKDSTGASNTISNSIFVYAAATLTITEGANNELTLNHNSSVSDVQWYLNGKPIAGANALTFTATQSGDYTAEALSTTGCTSASPVYHFANSAIDQNHPVTSLNVYPNPSAGTFNLEFELAVPKQVDIRVYNLLGEEVYYNNLGTVSGLMGKQLDMSRLPAGIYTLKLEAGNSASISRIAIEK